MTGRGWRVRTTPCALHRQLEDRLQQADFRLADLELRGVDRHRDAAGARVAVVAGQRDLAPLVERAALGQRERMRRNHQPAQQRAPQLVESTARYQKRPSVTSKCVGLFRLAPPAATQCATHWRRRSSGTPARRAARGSGSSR